MHSLPLRRVRRIISPIQPLSFTHITIVQSSVRTFPDCTEVVTHAVNRGSGVESGSGVERGSGVDRGAGVGAKVRRQ